MKSRTVGRLVRLAVAIFFVAAIVTPASAGPAVPSKVTNFFTNALVTFKSVGMR